MVAFSYGEGLILPERRVLEKPRKIMVKLAASMLAAFIRRTFPFSKGRLEGEKERTILDDIVPDIVA
jgi:ABC-type enterochelin transport system ATPase subunit